MDRTRSSNGGELSSGTLPSLFSLCNGTVSTTMAGKDLDGLIALNDNALSQQIEFILQDATMEQDENAQETTQQQNLSMQQHAVRMVKAKESMSMDYDSNSQANSLSPTAAIKLETPPTSTTPITSASELSQTGLESEFTQVESPKNQIQLQITQQPDHVHQQLQHHPHPHHLQQHLLNGRRIIVRSSALNEISTINITNLNGQQLLSQLSGEEEDPELNDENLQDIEEEAKAAEAEEEPSLQFHTNAHIKLEDPTELITDTPADGSHLEFVTNGTAGPIQSTQLVLPRSITVPVSEALAHLQRRPVYISNAVGNIHGGTLVRMPAVINRNGSMTLFNVVQQNGVGGAPTTTQLIVQTATMANGNNGLTDGTPLMVTSSAQTNKIITGAVSPTLTTSSPISASANATVLINTNAPPTNAKTIVSNNKANFSRIMGAATAPSITSATITEQQFETHPVASTSAAALATLNALNNSNNSLQSSSTTIPTATATSSPSPTSTTSTPPGGIIYQCVDCVEKFDSKDLFDIHRSGHANNMKCAICNMVLKSLKNYEKHCLRCKPYECQICGRVVRFRPNFIKHMRVHTGQQSERHKYKCEVCHKEFMSFEYFKVHKKIHNENVNLTCEICGKVFSALASLRGHSKLHSGVKLHKCDVCGKGFGQRYNLKIHARTHTGDFPYECKVCKKKLHTQSSLQTHMQVHQREQTSQAAANTASVATSSTIRYQSSGGQGDMLVQNASPTSTHTVIKIEPRSSSSSSSSPNAKHSLRAKTVLQNLQSLKQLDIMHEHEENDGGDDRNDDTIDHDEDNNSGMSEGSLSGNGFSQSAQNLSHHSYMGVRDCRNGFNDNTSDSSNSSLNDLRPEQPHLVLGTPTRTIIINNYLASESEKEQQSQAQPPQHNQAQVIRQNKNVGGSVLQQQLLRKTPIIHSTSGLTNNIMHTTTTAAAQSVVQQTGTPSATLLNSTTSSSMSGRSIKTVHTTGPFATSTIIRSTHNSQQQTQPYNINTTNNSNKKHNNKNQKQQQSSLYQRNNHRNHHRRRHLTDLDDDGDDDDDDDDHDDDDDENVGVNNVKLPRPNISITTNGRRHYDDDDDMMVDEKSSPSLALTAIKVEPNLYATGDNSNEMLIKEEAIFDDSPTPNSPQSPPSSRYRMSNFDHDLDHHVDLSHSLPTYGYLLDHHTIPDSMPAQLYADDDDDFNLGHNALTGGGTSALTTDGDYIKKEWPSYSSTSGYSINGKFDEDSDVLCDAANFIYN